MNATKACPHCPVLSSSQKSKFLKNLHVQHATRAEYETDCNEQCFSEFRNDFFDSEHQPERPEPTNSVALLMITAFYEAQEPKKRTADAGRKKWVSLRSIILVAACDCKTCGQGENDMFLTLQKGTLLRHRCIHNSKTFYQSIRLCAKLRKVAASSVSLETLMYQAAQLESAILVWVRNGLELLTIAS